MRKSLFYGKLIEQLPTIEAGGCKFSCYTSKIKTKKGVEYYRLFCSKTDKKCKPYGIPDATTAAPSASVIATTSVPLETIIEATTKPSGAKKDWLEVGRFKKDEFGDKIWIPNEYRYPHKDPRLNVKKSYSGKGAMMNINWKIKVPEDYPDCICLINPEKRNNYDVLYGKCW